MDDDDWEQAELRDMAQDAINDLHDTIERLTTRIKVLEKAGSALIADVKRRHPGEELRCQYMRALDAALEQGK